MINDIASRFALLNNNTLNKSDNLAKSDDINAFNKLLNSPKESSRSSLDFSGDNHSRNSHLSNAQNTENNNKLLKAAREASEKMIDSSAEALAQRVENHKDGVRLESSGSSVKKATEIFKEIKF